jgi:acyl-CoA thioesterase-2
MAGALRIERVGDLLFRADAARAGKQHRVFGGQLMAQALLASGRTVAPGLGPHLLHARFLRPGDPDQDLDYHIAPFTDRGSFAHRRVVARQGETQVLDLTASFHRAENGPEHQFPPRTEDDPGDLPTFRDLAASGGDESTRRWWARLSRWLPVEVRAPMVPGRWLPPPGGEIVPRQQVWLRGDGELGQDPLAHAAAAAYASDLFLLTAGMMRHGLRHDDDGVLAVTLNHTMWFHRAFRADQWWRYDQEGVWSGAGRLLCRGQMFDPSGRLVATAMQEGLLRVSEQGLRTSAGRLAG